MEGKWDLKLWRPTATNVGTGVRDIPDTQLTQIFEKIAELTIILTKMPHNPFYWSLRGALLLRIGYPELAAGDARKSQQLGTALLNRGEAGLAARAELVDSMDINNSIRVLKTAAFLQDQSSWETIVKDLHFQAFDVLAQALNEAGAFLNFREMCLEARALYPADDIFSSDLNSSTAHIEASKKEQREMAKNYPDLVRSSQVGASESLQFGYVDFRRYPFVPLEYLYRRATLFEAINTDLLATAPCHIQPSNVRVSAVDRASNIKMEEYNNVGLFATSNIKKGDIIAKDTTTWCAIATPTGAIRVLRCDNCHDRVVPGLEEHLSECCNTAYCSSSCLKLAENAYHKVQCGKDFSWIASKDPDSVNMSDTDGPVWLRILSTCVQSNLHPLEHPVLAALSANYESEEPTKRRWSMPSHIDVPQRILTILGVDIFSDLRYDTWVLQTIWVRLINNQQGGLGKRRDVILSRAVFPLYSCINHSCDANAMIWSYLEKPSAAYWNHDSMFDGITFTRIGGVVIAINSGGNDDPDLNSNMKKFAAAVFKASAKVEANNPSAKKDSKPDIPGDTRSEAQRLLDELTNAHPSAERLTPGIGVASSDDSDGDDTDDRKYSECAEISIIAKKDIKAGEEIFVSYLCNLSPEADLNKRRFCLRMNWLSGDCMCTRCIEEDTESASTAATPDDHLVESLANLNISAPGSPPALTKNQRKNRKKREKLRSAKQAAHDQQVEGGH